MAKATTKKAAESKETKAAPKAGTIAPTRKQLDELPANVDAGEVMKGLIGSKRLFSSGSTGYNVNGKILIGGLKHTVSCNIVAIGSKDIK